MSTPINSCPYSLFVEKVGDGIDQFTAMPLELGVAELMLHLIAFLELELEPVHLGVIPGVAEVLLAKPLHVRARKFLDETSCEIAIMCPLADC